MSENPVKPVASAVSKSSILKKKVAGVPVVYLALGFVLILAVVAWKMKPSASADSSAGTDSEGQTESSTDTILSESGDGYPPLPLGTVVAAPQGTDNGTSGGNTTIDTNDEWLRRGVMFLSTSKGVSPGEAQQALSLYLDGADLSYQQGQWRDDAIRELGVPPYPVNIGGTASEPARAQGPLPRDHIVKGNADDTAGELAVLYYGTSASPGPSNIARANNGQSSYKVGQSVHIPVREYTTTTTTKTTSKPATSKPKPKPSPPPTRYYTVKKGDTLSGIARRYYGSYDQWRKIYNANRSKIKDPDLIYPGQKFVIPR